MTPPSSANFDASSAAPHAIAGAAPESPVAALRLPQAMTNAHARAQLAAANFHPQCPSSDHSSTGHRRPHRRDIRPHQRNPLPRSRGALSEQERASTSFAAPKRTGSSAGSPVSSSAAATAARAASSSSSRVLSAIAADPRRPRRERQPLVQLDELAERRDRMRAAARALDLGAARLMAEDEQVRRAAVEEAERHAGVDRMDDRALPLDPEQPRRRARAPSTTSRSAAPAMKSATTASTAMPQPAIAMPVCPVGTNTDRDAAPAGLEVELERHGHLPDRAVRADREHDRARAPRDSRRSRSRDRRAAGAGRAARRSCALPRARAARGRPRGRRAGRSRCRGPSLDALVSRSIHAGGKRPPCVATPTSAVFGSKRSASSTLPHDRARRRRVSPGGRVESRIATTSSRR